MNEGDIVLAALPQADGVHKTRPAVVLRALPPFGDALICGVSSQVQQFVKDFDELVTPADLDYKDSGLKAPSVIRLGFLISIGAARVVGRIGKIDSQRHRRLLMRLSKRLQP